MEVTKPIFSKKIIPMDMLIQNFMKKKLENYKNQKINILEIGSYAGASAASFVKYLPESKVFCFDINISNFEFKSEKIFVFRVDINNKKKFLQI